MPTLPKWIPLVLATLTVLVWTMTAHADELERVRDGELRLPHATRVNRFDPRLKGLWLEALGRSENDLKCQAAEAIHRAHLKGMPDLTDTAPRLLEELTTRNAHPLVRLKTAQALISLNARQAAPALLKLAQEGGPEAAQLVEPALMQWNDPASRQAWLKRLEDSSAPQWALLLAIQAAEQTRMTESAPALTRIVQNDAAGLRVRSTAAQALAVLHPRELEKEVRTLMATNSHPTQAHLIAATLLTHHQGPAAEELLLQLAKDSDVATASRALGRLIEINPVKVQPLVADLVKSKSDNLRSLGARALAGSPTPESVLTLGSLLNDPNVTVRNSARKSLIHLNEQNSLKSVIRETVLKRLTTAEPRGCQQAILLTVAFRHEAAVDRLIPLLENRTAEVGVTAAWALRRLAVPSSATAIQKWVAEQINKNPQSLSAAEKAAYLEAFPTTVRQLDHLIEALGVLKHEPAAPLLKQFLGKIPPAPKKKGNDPDPITWQPSLREAAAWSMGRIFADSPRPEWSKLLHGVLDNIETKPPEKYDSVRAMAALSLGRMKARDEVPLLNKMVVDKSQPAEVAFACSWALGQITGEQKPFPPKVEEVWQHGWFLEPVDSR
jgi:HEAT repeat protein